MEIWYECFAIIVDLSSVILLSSKLHIFLCLIGGLSKNPIRCQSFDHVLDVFWN